jgi:serine/threonine-protein kinase ULK4
MKVCLYTVCEVQMKRGTPSYMAPELFQEGAPHSYASDLWALGCVLYEMAAGHPPFVSASFSELVHSVMDAEPEEIPGNADGQP